MWCYDTVRVMIEPPPPPSLFPVILRWQALFQKLGLQGKPAHTAPLQPPLEMGERVVVTHREVSGAGGAFIDTEETHPLRQAA